MFFLIIDIKLRNVVQSYLRVDGVDTVRDADVERVKGPVLPVELLSHVDFTVACRLHGELVPDIAVCVKNNLYLKNENLKKGKNSKV